MRAQNLIQPITDRREITSDGVLMDAWGQLMNSLTQLPTHIAPEFKTLSDDIQQREQPAEVRRSYPQSIWHAVVQY